GSSRRASSRCCCGACAPACMAVSSAAANIAVMLLVIADLRSNGSVPSAFQVRVATGRAKEVPRQYNSGMRYLVTARVKRGRTDALAHAIEDRTLGRGSIAGDEYLRNMAGARQLDDDRVQWVEVCYCPTPLAEERPYW